MAVFLAIPSALPADRCNANLLIWRTRGYKLAIFRDIGDEPVNAELQVFAPYLGYPHAANLLCRAVFAAFEDVNFCVNAGDDMTPADIPADEIERAALAHFGGTMGVLQPTGDPFGMDRFGRSAAERICGSPWLGRDFVASRNGRVFSESYRHFFADEQLYDELIGTPLLWQNKSLEQRHNHYHRTHESAPAHMSALRTRDLWNHDQAVYREWKENRLKTTEDR